MNASAVTGWSTRLFAGFVKYSAAQYSLLINWFLSRSLLTANEYCSLCAVSHIPIFVPVDDRISSLAMFVS